MRARADSTDTHEEQWKGTEKTMFIEVRTTPLSAKGSRLSCENKRGTSLVIEISGFSGSDQCDRGVRCDVT
jgi:hypothetical protein